VKTFFEPQVNKYQSVRRIWAWVDFSTNYPI